MRPRRRSAFDALRCFITWTYRNGDRPAFPPRATQYHFHAQPTKDEGTFMPVAVETMPSHRPSSLWARAAHVAGWLLLGAAIVALGDELALAFESVRVGGFRVDLGRPALHFSYRARRANLVRENGGANAGLASGLRLCEHCLRCPPRYFGLPPSRLVARAFAAGQAVLDGRRCALTRSRATQPLIIQVGQAEP